MAKSQRRAKAEGEQWYPKGFDITLMQVIEEFDLNEAECTHIGRITNTLAHATFGYEVFYRRNQIEGIIAEMRTQSVEFTGLQVFEGKEDKAKVVDESTVVEEADGE